MPFRLACQVVEDCPHAATHLNVRREYQGRKPSGQAQVGAAEKTPACPAHRDQWALALPWRPDGPTTPQSASEAELHDETT